MDKFIVILFISLICVVLFIDTTGSLLLDKRYFSFRAWESVSNHNQEPYGPFKSNTIYEGTIFGDLANMFAVSRFKQPRYQQFSTDFYGFRNPNQNQVENYPVIVLGDSDMAGSSLSDDQVFNVKLSKLLQVPVYNYAPNDPVSFLRDPRFIHSPPKLVIWGQIERTIMTNYHHIQEVPKSRKQNSSVVQDIEARSKPLRLSQHHSRWWLNTVLWTLVGQSRILNPKIAYVSPQTSMLYYHEGIQALQLTPKQRGIELMVQRINTVNRLYLARGIRLIYMPLPDKENIYRSALPKKLQIPKDSPVFLKLLGQRLDEIGVYNVKLYSEYMKQQRDKLLYFLDDTHWNENGVNLAAHLAAQTVNSISQ